MSARRSRAAEAISGSANKLGPFAGRTGRKFERDFLAASGCRAIIGYTTDVGWMDSMFTDLLFLHRFYADDDPWTNIRAIHESVLADFALAQQLGYELHMPD